MTLYETAFIDCTDLDGYLGIEPRLQSELNALAKRGFETFAVTPLVVDGRTKAIVISAKKSAPG